MGITDNIKAPLRHWRGHGFGIHSPFAYSMITDTLHITARYYVYDYIDEHYGSTDQRNWLKLLTRILVRFNPSTICIIGDAGAERDIIGRVTSKAAILDRFECDQQPELVIISDNALYSMPDAFSGVTLIRSIGDCRGKKILAQFDAIDYGMTFNNTHSAVACMFSHLPSQSFKVAF